MGRGFTRALARAAARDAGVQGNVAGLQVVTSGVGMFRTVFTLNAMPIPVTDALAYASVKIFDFSPGKIRLLGGTSKLAFAVTTARTTINDSASLTYALGSVAASNITLSSTMVDFIAKTTKVLDGAVAAYTSNSAADFAAAATFDGTTTAIDLYFNVGFETNTQIDADGTLAVNGTIIMLWQNWGDNV